MLLTDACQQAMQGIGVQAPQVDEKIGMAPSLNQ
jgi:hypothetical protein